MATEGSVFDGFTSIVAQDADTHPSYLPEFYVAESVNRTFRGGINRTRPSIRNIKLIAAEGEEDSIVNDNHSAIFSRSQRTHSSIWSSKSTHATSASPAD